MIDVINLGMIISAKLVDNSLTWKATWGYN